jgi:N6-adenosine-specific RNA methylase IME4
MTPPSKFVGPLVGRYRTIVVDPPWPERGAGLIKRGADRHYMLMSLADICDLPVEQLADPSGCHLYLFATNNYLGQAFYVLTAWGFEFVTNRTWVKAEVAGTTPDGKPLYALQPAGLGQYFRGDSEQLLFARLGPPLPYRKRPDTGKRAQG